MSVIKELCIADWDAPKFWIGDRIFFIVTGKDSLRVTEKCPVCNDTGIITYVGKDGIERETHCPNCKTSSIVKETFNKYEILEAYVYQVEFKTCETSRTAFREAKGILQNLEGTITLHAIASTGRCSDDFKTFRVPVRSEDKIDCLEPHLGYSYGDSIYCYTTKALATKALNYIVEQEKKRLAEVNDKYGTNHEYPW